jgi:site-specific recombinase XerC
MDLDTAIKEWLSDLELGGRQPGTRMKHQQELVRLSAWCDETGHNWQTLTKKQLTVYARLRAGLGHSARSNMFCSLRTFFRWSVEQEYVALSPAATFKTPIKPHPLPRSLTVDQVRVLVHYLHEQPGHRARRDESMVLTGLYSGLRAAELAGLRWSMVDIASGIINIRLSKMNKGRSVKIHSELANNLASWKTMQALGDTAPVFSLDTTPIQANRVGKICRKIAISTGLPLTAHVLRHTFATHSLRKSGNLYAVSKALGHSQLRQTEVYLAADVSDSAPAVDSLPPLGSW